MKLIPYFLLFLGFGVVVHYSELEEIKRGVAADEVQTTDKENTNSEKVENEKIPDKLEKNCSEYLSSNDILNSLKCFKETNNQEEYKKAKEKCLLITKKENFKEFKKLPKKLQGSYNLFTKESISEECYEGWKNAFFETVSAREVRREHIGKNKPKTSLNTRAKNKIQNCNNSLSVKRCEILVNSENKSYFDSDTCVVDKINASELIKKFHALGDTINNYETNIVDIETKNKISKFLFSISLKNIEENKNLFSCNYKELQKESNKYTCQNKEGPTISSVIYNIIKVKFDSKIPFNEDSAVNTAHISILGEDFLHNLKINQCVNEVNNKKVSEKAD